MSEASAWWQRWPQWIGYIAAIWSLVYGALGLYWTLGAPGFPFGSENDEKVPGSLLASVRAETAAPVIAALGLVGALVALAMVRTWGRGFLRVALLAFASVAALVLTLVITDYRVLVAVAYTPLFLFGAPFHWPQVSYLDAVPWPVLNQVVCMAGGIVWAGTAISYQSRTGGACMYCGRIASDTGWATPSSAARWGRWAVCAAVSVPLVYALTRYAWLLGIPLGITEDYLREGQATSMWVAGAGLATVGVGGALLTLGLVQRWGEVFPRWMLGLGGKRVPIWLAVVPAVAVSVVVTSAGLSFWRTFLNSQIPADSWTTIGPVMLFPFWGVALAAATLAYYLRRRGRCRFCGRGT
ncbi:MAG: hypothetical protein ACYC4L_17080 [Chloroflexota bacterium]